MNLHTYDTTALTDGAACQWCGAVLGAVHYQLPEAPAPVFCRPACALDYRRREAKRSTSQPAQIGLAL